MNLMELKSANQKTENSTTYLYYITIEDEDLNTTSEYCLKVIDINYDIISYDFYKDENSEPLNIYDDNVKDFVYKVVHIQTTDITHFKVKKNESGYSIINL